MVRPRLIVGLALLVSGCAGPRWLGITTVSDGATMGLAADAALRCGYAQVRLERIYAAQTSANTRMKVLAPKGVKEPHTLGNCLNAWFDAHPEFDFETEVRTRGD